MKKYLLKDREPKRRKRRRPVDTTLCIEERLSEKSAGRMPWHWEPKKDVTSCEKLRGGANIH